MPKNIDIVTQPALLVMISVDRVVIGNMCPSSMIFQWLEKSKKTTGEFAR